jgi:hypothetical protein
MGVPQDETPEETGESMGTEGSAPEADARPELEVGAEEGVPPEEEPSVQPASDDSVQPASDEERTMGMLCHLLALAGFIGIPFGNILGPLIIWMIKREEMPFVDDQGKESLNFQITLPIAALVSAALTCVFIGFVLLPVVAIAGLVFVIIAGIRANKGELYRYPVNIRFIK